MRRHDHEIEPCLGGASMAPSPDSAASAFTSVSARRPDHTRRCIILLLLITIFLFAVFLAFLTGQWLTEQKIARNGSFDAEDRFLRGQQPIALLMEPSGSNRPDPRYYSQHKEHTDNTTSTTLSTTHSTTRASIKTTQPRTRTVTSSTRAATTTTLKTTLPPPTTQRHREKIIPLSAERVNLTLMDVHPPHVVFDFIETHGGSQRSHKRSPLVKLPEHIFPSKYDLSIDFTSFATDEKFTANVTVHLESRANGTELAELAFHAGNRLQLRRVRLRVLDGVRERNVPITSVKQELSRKIVRLTLKDRLKRGKYFLDITYQSEICGDENSGVYCDRNLDERNASIRVTSFTTKFEPALARSFVPCWDEPHFKATWNVSVRHQSDVVVLSNSAVIEDRRRRRRGEDGEDDMEQEKRALKDKGRKASVSKDRKPGVVWTRFHETPPMSSYLLAFAVGDFTRLEVRSDRDLPITVWTQREDFLAARFAANFAPLMFDRQEEQFEVPFPLQKLDLVAARGYPVGGMENWGLVVFSYTSLLLDTAYEESPNMTVDKLHKEYSIEKIVSHEIAHQWFGNLVTMADWSELWLNEAFATYFAYDLMQDDHPVLTDAEYYMRKANLVRQQSANERPALVRALHTDGEVESAFHSTHLYTKGCVLVRMARDLVGDMDFRAGIRRYLRRNAYTAVGREELWAALPAFADHGADNARLAEVMEPWLVNDGLPEVTVTRNYEADTVRVGQSRARHNKHRVYLHDSAVDEEKQKEKWRRRRETRSIPSSTHAPFDGRRFRSKQRSSEFDEDMFDDLSTRQKQQLKKRRQQQRRRKQHHRPASYIQPSADIWIETRKEETRKSRKAREPSDLWSVPFSYMFGSLKSTEGQVMRQFWLHNRSLSFEDAELTPTQPLLANPDWVYPYRVNYDTNNWKMLARLLHQSHVEIPAHSRMQLIVDSEFYLADSNSPHLYIYLLGYLSHETDLGVALLGLDALHRLVDAFRGTSINNALLLYVAPVISNIDSLLTDSQSDPERAALWMIEPARLTRLYQLRCAANLPSCEQEKHTVDWLGGRLDADPFQMATAVCHQLYSRGGEREHAHLRSLLDSRGDQWTTSIQLGGCARSASLAALTASYIVRMRNAAMLVSALQSDFDLHYNWAFRSALWKAVSRLSLGERKALFSADQSTPTHHAGIVLIHQIRTVKELELVRGVVDWWGDRMEKHLEFVERRVRWQESVADADLRRFFSTPL